ncbi:MAG: CCA tRNA nucleotidyltransferase [Bacteroidia bacterium]|nr:HD domain-containing protein [Bacteroidia bacterium]MCO5253689.1 CCA tRNA nucleotidyltransferase [Bacteroidota bacterium]MCZ2129610.1 CCA tRNA nucleotidyltransferase [Bacteroidia bacterium]
MRIELSGIIIDKLKDTSKQTLQPAWLIGGYVRDLLLQRECKDMDVVVLGSGIEFAKRFAENLEENVSVSYFKNFGTAQVKYEDFEIEFVGARKESYQRDSRKPFVEDGTLEDDQKRRDFTINTLSISLNEADAGELFDPFEGLKDLEDKIIRTPLDPDKTFSDDPLRMMRAIRFAAQLGFEIEEKTLNSIAKNKERIQIISGERIISELNKIILSVKPSVGFNYLFDTGLLHIIFPEMVALHGVEWINGKGHKDNFYHTLAVLDNVAKQSDNLWLRWAAILHDIAKPATKKFIEGDGWTFHGHEDKGARMVKPLFRRMKLPLNEKMKYVEKLVFLHLRPIALTKETVTDSAVRRLMVEAGEAIEDLLILCQSDITSKNEAKKKKYLANLELVKQKIAEVGEKDRLRNWQPPISGNDILNSFSISDPKQIGILKNKIREAILEGTIEDNKTKAFEFMMREGKSMGLQITNSLNTTKNK